MKIISKYISFLLSIVLFVGLTSCEKEAKNVDLPVVQPKLVVASFLTPGAQVNKLFLSWSVPIYHNSNNDFKFESNADVFIIHNSQEYKMQYNFQDQNYEIDYTKLKINEGENYQLKIVSDQSKTLTATTIIPPKPQFDAQFIRIDSITNTDPDGYTSSEYLVFIDISIKNAEPEAYYRISAGSAKNNMYLGDFYIEGGENRKISGNYNKTLRMSPQYNGSNSFNPDKIILKVEKVDEAFYRYHHALENYYGDDFFAEPTQIYSNVENGLGVFCSHNIAVDILVVK